MNNFGINNVQNSCDVPLASLNAWAFTAGDSLTAQIRACNTLCSEASVSNPSVLPSAPDAISRPVEVSRNGGSI
jgi:hypothetical protein